MAKLISVAMVADVVWAGQPTFEPRGIKLTGGLATNGLSSAGLSVTPITNAPDAKAKSSASQVVVGRPLELMTK